MLIGEIIANYRREHGLSQRQFAEKCGGITNGYISMLENNRNPSTGQPITPSFDKLLRIANGMDMSLRDLIDLADDMPVDISGEEESLPQSTQTDIIYISHGSGDDSIDDLRRQLHDFIDSLADDELRAMSIMFKLPRP